MDTYISEEFISRFMHEIITEASYMIIVTIANSVFANGKNNKPAKMADELMQKYQIYLYLEMAKREAATIDPYPSMKSTQLALYHLDAADSIQAIQEQLTKISLSRADGGVDGLKSIEKNLTEDPGFSYSYMKMDLSPLKDKTKDTRQKFLNDLRDLIDRYAAEDSGIELFD